MENEPRPGAHARLREATRPAHDRVDSAFSGFDLSNCDDYATFLVRHAAAFLPAEQALTEAGAGRLIAGWEELRRGPLLESDLVQLEKTLPEPVEPPVFGSIAAIIGGAYVLEGSRLGGALLKRQVPDDFPRRFLDAVQPSGRWRAFVAGLDRLLYRDVDIEEAIASAVQTFAMFEPVAE